MSECKKKELNLRDKAILHQQRRLKQAVQFTHKDSADLLPLDGLNRMGTAKSLQPHSIVQRRLLESNITRLHVDAKDMASRVCSPLAEQTERLNVKEDAACLNQWDSLKVSCTCYDREVKATINTGCKDSTISRGCLNTLGLKEFLEREDAAHGRSMHSLTTPAQVETLQLMLGKEKVECSALIVDDEKSELCLGLRTLLSLRVRKSTISLCIVPAPWPVCVCSSVSFYFVCLLFFMLSCFLLLFLYSFD
uniref:Uncharacterized protein n=1 Tax=Callorhinchus milii TaxID=7868 RepID=A0A4W3IN46_CALMI